MCVCSYSVVVFVFILVSVFLLGSFYFVVWPWPFGDITFWRFMLFSVKTLNRIINMYKKQNKNVTCLFWSLYLCISLISAALLHSMLSHRSHWRSMAAVFNAVCMPKIPMMMKGIKNFWKNIYSHPHEVFMRDILSYCKKPMPRHILHVTKTLWLHSVGTRLVCLWSRVD